MSFVSALAELHYALDQSERSVAATGAALLLGMPERVQAETRELHDCARALALALRGVDGDTSWVKAARERLVQVARDIAMQREALLRRSAAVELSLQSLVPQAPPPTYTGALGRYTGHGIPVSAFRSF